jgi:uncharacterized protein (DUF697 family)
MGHKIARIRGVEITHQQAGDVFKEIVGAVGLGFAAQQAAIGLYKIGLPFFGGLMTFPLVASLTVGIGRAMDLYFEHRSRGVPTTPGQLKDIYRRAKEEGGQIERPAIPKLSPRTEAESPTVPHPSEANAQVRARGIASAAAPAKQLVQARHSETKEDWNKRPENRKLRVLCEDFFGQQVHFLDLRANEQEVLRQLLAEQPAPPPDETEAPNLSNNLEKLKHENARQADRIRTLQALQERQLECSWKVHFPKLRFETQPIRWTASRVQHREQLHVEIQLRQLNDIQDPGTLIQNRGKMVKSGEHHLRFVCGEVESRLFYRVGEGKRIVTCICHKHEVKAYERD